jgi:hypothetical protein
LGQRIGWTNVPVALWPLKSTLAMLPSRAWATNSEYGIAAADGTAERDEQDDVPDEDDRQEDQAHHPAGEPRPPGATALPGVGHVGRRL